MQFTPAAQHHIDQAAAALETGDYTLAHQHLDAAADTTPEDRILLAFIINATRQHAGR
jgi:uncharacterized protein HemY